LLKTVGCGRKSPVSQPPLGGELAQKNADNWPDNTAELDTFQLVFEKFLSPPPSLLIGDL
jgi:hypothetical protein